MDGIKVEKYFKFLQKLRRKRINKFMTKLIQQLGHSIQLSNLATMNIAPRCEFVGSWDYKARERVS